MEISVEIGLLTLLGLLAGLIGLFTSVDLQGILGLFGA